MNLELESSSELKCALLKTLALNLTGLPGHFEENVNILEYFNHLLEDIVKHKDAQFDDTFIQDMISRNLRQLSLLKKQWREEMGMSRKMGAHTAPHVKPERRLYPY